MNWSLHSKEISPFSGIYHPTSLRDHSQSHPTDVPVHGMPENVDQRHVTVRVVGNIVSGMHAGRKCHATFVLIQCGIAYQSFLAQSEATNDIGQSWARIKNDSDHYWIIGNGNFHWWKFNILRICGCFWLMPEWKLMNYSNTGIQSYLRRRVLCVSGMTRIIQFNAIMQCRKHKWGNNVFLIVIADSAMSKSFWNRWECGHLYVMVWT